jgi:hypothetical protein
MLVIVRVTMIGVVVAVGVAVCMRVPAAGAQAL